MLSDWDSDHTQGIFVAIASREQNERKFGHWEKLPSGGRRSFRNFAGRAGGRARYVKEVDEAETTIRFAQEIYNQAGHLVAVHEKFPVDLGHNKCRIGSMKITRQIAADKIADYLHGKLGQTELVDWAERAMMDEEFEEKDIEVLSDVIGRLGLADAAEFGLRWQDCEEFLRRLGYRARVIVSSE